MPFLINGSTASLAPYQQTWQDIVVGIDHQGRPIIAATKNVTLQFDACTYGSYQQWSQLHGTSLVSVQLLNLDAGSYTTFSNANITFQIADRPAFEAGYVGRWSAIIQGIVIA